MRTDISYRPEDLGRQRCRKKFLRHFPKGFHDEKYYLQERSSKAEAYQAFQNSLDMVRYTQLLQQKAYSEIATTVLQIEEEARLLSSQDITNLHKVMAPPDAAKTFATGLYDYIYRNRSLEERFEDYSQMFQVLSNGEANVYTWAIMTVFPAMANPEEHIFLKPRITQVAADKYVFPFYYSAKPNWKTYASLLSFANQITNDIDDLAPKDNIDLQSFICVIGSDKYAG